MDTPHAPGGLTWDGAHWIDAAGFATWQGVPLPGEANPNPSPESSVAVADVPSNPPPDSSVSEKTVNMLGATPGGLTWELSLPFKPFDPGQHVADLEAQRAAAIQAEQARIAAEQAPRHELAEIDQALVGARSQAADARFQAQCKRLAELDSESQMAIAELTSGLDPWVEALENGTTAPLPPLDSIPNRVDEIAREWEQIALSALADKDRAVAGELAATQGYNFRPDAQLQGRMQAEQQIGHAPLPSWLALQRWAMKAQGRRRTYCLVLAVAVTRNWNIQWANERCDYQAAADGGARARRENLAV